MGKNRMGRIYLPHSKLLCNTLIDVIENRVQQNGEKLGYRFLDDSLENQQVFQDMTYQQTLIKAKNIADILIKRGIKIGDRVLLIFAPGLDLITAFYGCLCAGAVAVIVYPPVNVRFVDKLQMIVQDAKPALILTTTDLKQKFTKLRLLKKASTMPLLGKVLHYQFKNYLNLGSWDEYLPFVTTDNIELDPNVDVIYPKITADSLAFLQYTSGSTDHPKGVMVSHGNLLHNLDLMQRAIKIKQDDVGTSWLPPYHDMGLIGAIIIPYFVGFQAILMSPLTFLKNPYQWMKTTSDFNGTISTAPNFSYEYCIRKITPEQKATLNLSSLRVLLNGAEPIHENTLERFYQAFKETGFKKDTFHPCYGLAEATLYVSGINTKKVQHISLSALQKHKLLLTNKMDKDAKTIVSCGTCSQEVKIVNPRTKELVQSNEIGEIWIHSESIAKGYWKKSRLTKKIFQAHIVGEDSKKNYLRTGDLGFVYKDELYVAGRLKDIIIIHGHNYYPQDIEYLVQDCHDKIRLGGCVAFSVESNDVENLVLVCEVEDSATQKDWAQMVDAICKSIAVEYELSVSSIVFIKARTLPKTTSGKVRRQPTKAAFLDGLLSMRHQWQAPKFLIDEEVSAPTQKDKSYSLTSWAKSWIESHTDKKININHTFIEQGLDSIAIVEFVQDLSEQVGFAIDPTLAWEYPSVKSLIEHISKNKDPFTSIGTITPQAQRANKKLSQGQLRLYYLHMMRPDSNAYNIGAAFRLQGNLVTKKLHAALEDMVEHHEVLRTIVRGKGEPSIMNKIKVKLRIKKLTTNDIETQKKSIDLLLQEETDKLYNLNKGPLIRFLLIQTGIEEHILLIAAHHIVFDGTSMFIFMKELMKYYDARVENKVMKMPATIQYYDYASWQDEHAKDTSQKTALAFWVNHLENVSTNLNLPYDNAKQWAEQSKVKRYKFELRSNMFSKIDKYCKQQNITPFIFLYTAFQLLLVNYTNQHDFVIGVPTNGRTIPDIRNLIGFFVNTLPIRATADKKLSIRELLKQNNKTFNQAHQYQDIQLPELFSALNVERDQKGETLFQTMFIMQSEIKLKLNGNHLVVTPLWSESGQVDYDITAEVIPLIDHYQLIFSYNSALFEEATLKRMAKHFKRVMNVMIKEPDQILSKISLLNSKEYEQIIYSWNANERAHPGNMTLHSLFEQQVKVSPDNTAIVIEGEEISYDQLNSKANQYAHYLIEKGVEPNDIIGICMPRSIEMIIGILAILKARGAYLSLSPDYPKLRLNELIEDSKCKWVLVNEIGSLPEIQHHRTLTIGELEQKSQRLGTHNPIFSTPQPDNTICYVIYTSGSTGKPKGVIIEHRTICGRFDDLMTMPILVKSFFHVSSFSFDASVLALWWPLLKGGKVVMAPDIKSWDVKSLQQTAQEQKITSLIITPSQLGALLLGANEKMFSTVEDVIIAGEALKIELVNNVKKLMKNARIWNGYGPTECTIVTSMPMVNDYTRRNVPIGGPLINDKYYVLNDEMLPVPIGVTGELYIGSQYLARGYLNKPTLNQTKFITDPFIHASPSKMYKTGDLVRWLPEGILEYIGRIDNQVKIRGMRVELGEIEITLSKHKKIKEAVVTMPVNRVKSQRLAAYLILEKDANLTIPEIKNYLSRHLPYYMVPSDIIFVDAFPMNQNGKIDYRALPLPERKKRPVITKNMDEIEKKLLLVFKKVLQHDQIDIEDNFFEIGGDSISSIHLTMMANEENINFSIHDLIKHPTIKELAALAAVREHSTIKRTRETTGDVPLTPIQHWFMEQSLREPNSWAQGMIFAIKPEVNFDLLESVLEHVISKHPALYMGYKLKNDDLKQFYTNSPPILEIEQYELSEKPIQQIVEEFSASLNLEKGPLFKIALVKDGQIRKLIVLIHHLVIDGVSWRILLRQINYCLEKSIQNISFTLPDEANSFKDWSLKLQQYAQSDELQLEKNYWSAIKVDSPSFDEKNIALQQDQRDGTFDLRLSIKNTKLLLNSRNKELKKNTMETILLAVLLSSYQKWVGKTELLLDLENYGREPLSNDVDVTQTVGWFTSIYPVLLQLPNDELSLIESIDAQLLSVPNKGIGYGVLRYLVKDLEVKNLLKKQDTAQVMFNYLGQISDNESDYLTIKDRPISIQSKQNKKDHVLEINTYIYKNALHLSFVYDRKYISDEELKVLVAIYRKSLLKFSKDSSEKKHLGTLIQLNKKRQGNNLFCIHPVSGNIVAYAKLANLLEKDYRFYAIQSSGLEGELKPSHSIEEMARHYIKDIKSIQVKGPYNLVGWSMGGLIAYEIAAQLTAEGEKVSFVNLIDVPDPDATPEVKSMDEKLFFYYFITLLEETIGYKYLKSMSMKIKMIMFLLKNFGSTHFLTRILSYFAKKGEGIETQDINKYVAMIKHDLSTVEKTQFPFGQWLKYMQSHGLLPPSINVDQLSNIYEVYRANFYAVQHYHPKMYNGKVVSFMAMDGLKQRHLYAGKENIEQIKIHGNHMNILRKADSLSVISKRLIKENKTGT